jgi:methylmalonyl-CoA mutase
MNTDTPLWHRWTTKVAAELAGQPGSSVDKLFTKLADGMPIAPLYPDPSPGQGSLSGARKGTPELVSWPATIGPGDLDLRSVEQDGASPTEELALALDTLHRAPNTPVIHLGVSPDILIQIAKLRAIRRLLLRLSEVDGAPRTTVVHAHTSLRSFTRHDPWVNLLRNSASVFAALLGGADRITPAPYDLALGEPSDEALRLADHTLRIALHESALGLEADPTAGSHAIEHLTDELCSSAWSLAATPDAIAARITATKATRAARVARRQPPDGGLIGTTLYPELDEVLPVRPPHAHDLGPRLATPFEALRATGLASNAHIFLATFGPLARHTARATWVAQLLASGGIRPIDTTPHTAVGHPTVEALVESFAASQTKLVILCVADPDWGDEAATLIDLARALTARGATVLVAGRPTPALTTLGATEPDLIAGYIHAGLPALDTLTDLHTRLVGAHA